MHDPESIEPTVVTALTMYPVGAPPVVGAVQTNVTCVFPAVAEVSVGAPGAAAAGPAGMFAAGRALYAVQLVSVGAHDFTPEA